MSEPHPVAPLPLLRRLLIGQRFLEQYAYNVPLIIFLRQRSRVAARLLFERHLIVFAIKLFGRIGVRAISAAINAGNTLHEFSSRG